MKKIIFTIMLACLSTVAFAKKTGKPTPQNHSCVLNDAVVEKTKKECIKAGGKWEKKAPAAADAAAPAADAKAPAEEAKPADAAKPAETPAK